MVAYAVSLLQKLEYCTATPGVARSWGLSGLGYRERQQPESKDLLK